MGVTKKPGRELPSALSPPFPMGKQFTLGRVWEVGTALKSGSLRRFGQCRQVSAFPCFPLSGPGRGSWERKRLEAEGKVEAEAEEA